MSVVALSPIGGEPTSPMITSVTMTHSNSLEEAVFPGHTPCRQRRAPPLHAGADWKVLLHLPEVQTWLRAAAGRVSQLTHSAGQDAEHRHIDTHLLQLKDICEDISDHVEQIHALLETEFSLKLLSYSVNIIVDIRAVQLLWHQLRVSVLVLKERLLQGLQDSNGNFTRQTDILQAFSQDQDQDQTRVDDLTEEDDCGRLTIRCSRDYFSLDCGITAFELSDYSPGDGPHPLLDPQHLQDPETQDPYYLQDPSPGPDPETQEPYYLQDRSPGPDPETQDPYYLQDPSPGPDPETQTRIQPGTPSGPPEPTPTHTSAPAPSAPSRHCGMFHQGEPSASKRPLASPTQPSLAKRAALVPGPSPGGPEGPGSPPASLLSQGEEGLRRLPLLEPDHSATFWLELDSGYPETPAHLQTPGGGEGSRTPERPSSLAGATGETPRPARDPPSSPGPLATPPPGRGASDSPVPSSGRGALSSCSDMEASGEESDPRAPGARRTARHPGPQGKDHWFGSEEFLALPDQLRHTELLAINLESLTQALPLRSSCDLDQRGLQDIDDWDLSEVSPDCYLPLEDTAYPQSRHHHFNIGRFSPSSSSDVPHSLDDSIESGPLSELLSEEDEGRSSGSVAPAPPVAGQGTTALVSQLLEGIQHHDPHILRKIEGFVTRLDVFIEWLKDALLSTDNWTPPRHDLDHLRDYLDTHLVRPTPV
ncbi:A-kinase anchor protein 6 [Gadus chalcogrammus]|uniref:A-kinase anchor protein 6 n=1 Tax=Gadus chalcogrammus TaxID=1042646 RepID=UPI0024C37E3B|nr:A-kinase anchor protein 6 [Gadus chalcogrammus]